MAWGSALPGARPAFGIHFLSVCVFLRREAVAELSLLHFGVICEETANSSRGWGSRRGAERANPSWLSFFPSVKSASVHAPEGQEGASSFIFLR